MREPLKYPVKLACIDTIRETRPPGEQDARNRTRRFLANSHDIWLHETGMVELICRKTEAIRYIGPGGWIEAEPPAEVCPQCSKRFANKAGLGGHLSTYHKDNASPANP